MNIINGLRGWRRDIKQLLHTSRNLTAAVYQQSDLLDRKLERIIDGQDSLASLVNGRLPTGTDTDDGLRQLPPSPENRAPLIADRTHNPYHPDYQPGSVRNYPGALFNGNAHCTNPAFVALTERLSAEELLSGVWDRPLAEALIEVSSVDGAVEVFERLAFLENAMTSLGAGLDGQACAQCLRLDRMLFLYWLVRRTKPRTIVQYGAYNGLSTSFLMLALAKNGGDGSLSVIDPPSRCQTRMHGPLACCALIPEGKTTAWMLPEAHLGRLTVREGDVTQLPDIIDQFDTIDVFCYGADPIHQHALVAFQAAYRKIAADGLVLAEHVPWHTAVWDFADGLGAPSYNFKGQIGVAFL